MQHRMPDIVKEARTTRTVLYGLLLVPTLVGGLAGLAVWFQIGTQGAQLLQWSLFGASQGGVLGFILYGAIGCSRRGRRATSVLHEWKQHEEHARTYAPTDATLRESIASVTFELKRLSLMTRTDELAIAKRDLRRTLRALRAAAGDTRGNKATDLADRLRPRSRVEQIGS
jgi:hypothetical protein